jgi:hypothetical protein
MPDTCELKASSHRRSAKGCGEQATVETMGTIRIDRDAVNTRQTHSGKISADDCSSSRVSSHPSFRRRITQIFQQYYRLDAVTEQGMRYDAKSIPGACL